MGQRMKAAWDRVPGWARALVAMAGFAGVATWLTVTTWHQLSSSRLDVGLLTDFRDAIYYPVVALRDGVNPYNVDLYYQHYPVGQEFPLYTPIHLLLNYPLSWLSFATARAVAFGWNLFLVLGFAVAALRLARHRPTIASIFGLATLILLSDPGKFDLRTGQPTLIIAISVYAALRALPWMRRTLDPDAIPVGALAFGLGVLGLAVVWSKPTFAIPVTVVLLALGRPRLAVAGAALGAALGAVMLPALIDAAGSFSALVDSWRESARITSQSPQSKLGSGLRIDLGNTFVRITRIRPSEGLAAIGGLVVLIAGAWLLRRLHRRDPAHDREELTVTLACLLILVPMYHVPYDYLLLVGPLVMLARPGATVSIAWPRRARLAVALLLLMPVIDPLGWSPINAVLGKSGFEWMFGTTMMSTYVLVALGLCIWTALRTTRTAVPEAQTVR